MAEIKSRIGIFPDIPAEHRKGEKQIKIRKKKKNYAFFSASAWEAVFHVSFYGIGISRATPNFLSSLSRVIPKSLSPSSLG